MVLNCARGGVRSLDDRVTAELASKLDSSALAPAIAPLATAAALDAALLGKADASALASLLSTVDGLDTPLEVDTKIANALLGLAAC